MKKARLVVGTFVLSVLFNASRAQVHSVYDYEHLINTSKSDSIASIERLSAIEFHKLLNTYRLSKKLDSVVWNETLWIASRNHCVWMSSAEKLSHHQTPKTTHFTGKDPGDRYDYSSGGSAAFSWSGENALYNYSNYGNTINAIAKNIARQSFEQWKNSSGHNTNMLSKSHGMHGTAFIIYNDKVWGTDLFASCNECPQPQEEIRLYAQQKKEDNKSNSKKQQTIVNYAKAPKINLAKTKDELSKKIHSGITQSLEFKLKVNSKLNDEAYLLSQKVLNKKFSTINDGSVLMSSNEEHETGGFLGLFTKAKYTYTVVLEKDMNEFNLDSIANELETLIKQNQLFSDKRKIGMGLSIKKKSNIIRVTLVSILV